MCSFRRIFELRGELLTDGCIQNIVWSRCEENSRFDEPPGIFQILPQCLLDFALTCNVSCKLKLERSWLRLAHNGEFLQLEVSSPWTESFIFQIVLHNLVEVFKSKLPTK